MSEVLSFGPKRSRLCPPERKLLSDYVIYCIPPFALFTQGMLSVFTFVVFVMHSVLVLLRFYEYFDGVG